MSTSAQFGSWFGDVQDLDGGGPTFGYQRLLMKQQLRKRYESDGLTVDAFYIDTQAPKPVAQLDLVECLCCAGCCRRESKKPALSRMAEPPTQREELATCPSPLH